MKRIPYSVALTLAWLGGCAVLPPAEGPPPVSVNSAVVALVDSARADAIAGKPAVAAASLERALRIEPRNPAIWHELAQLRLQQREWEQTESLAAKSNAFAGKDARLRAANWRLIAEARLQRGDDVGAREAYERAARGN